MVNLVTELIDFIFYFPRCEIQPTIKFSKMMIYNKSVWMKLKTRAEHIKK